MTTEFIAIEFDEENGNEEWWQSVQDRFPGFASSLFRNRCAVIARPLWEELASLPGFEGGPDFAPNPLIDCGSDGERFADVVGRIHAVFEELD